MKPYLLLEIANCHGGSLPYVRALLDELAEFSGPGFGIKFQPFQADEIALPDFHAYGIYERLFFERAQWKEIILAAKRTKEVWLDLFDRYSLTVLRDSLQDITGVKLQASMLGNQAIIDELAGIELGDKTLILNVAAHELDAISRIVPRLQQALEPSALVLQVGFQAYPTELADAGLAKLSAMRASFAHALSFADHTDASSEHAIWLPVIASVMGAALIEKHVRHSTLPTEFDHFSSIKPEGVRRLVALRQQYLGAVEQPFINERERAYLSSSRLVPIVGRAKEAGDLVTPARDFTFRRTAQLGLDLESVTARAEAGSVLSVAKPTGTTLRREDFRAATIGTLIACRLKSTRLPAKALAPVGSQSAVARCIRTCLLFEGVHHTVLATSTEDEDAKLHAHTYHPSVLFRRGHPIDVIQRYLDIADELRLDAIIRVTADNLYMPPEIQQILLREHFRVGADYTSARQAAIGTNLEIITTSALRRIKRHFPDASYSEYMTYYFLSNPEHFHMHYVDLPPELVRDYRLTLDYAEDLDVVRAIEAHYDTARVEHSGRQLFDYLDAHPEVAEKNAMHKQQYATQQALIEELRRNTTIDKSKLA